MTHRLGTFEEWYQWEMKQRDNPKTWHYPTELQFVEDEGTHMACDQKHYPNTAVYRTRKTEYVNEFIQ